MEKLVERAEKRSGLTMIAGNEKSPKSLDTQEISDLVRVAGLDLHFAKGEIIVATSF